MLPDNNCKEQWKNTNYNTNFQICAEQIGYKQTRPGDSGI